MKTIEKIIEHHLQKIDEIESEIHTLTDKLRQLEGRKKYLYEKVNKLDEQRMDALSDNEDTVHQQLFGI
jgi:hypothetical protein